MGKTKVDKAVGSRSRMDKSEQTEPAVIKKKKKQKSESSANNKDKATKLDDGKNNVLPKKGGKWYKPKKFLWKYPLVKGVKAVAITMILVMIICLIIVTLTAVIMMYKYDTTDFIVINALAYTFTELAFTILMTIIHFLLFLSTKWKSLKKKNNILVSWIATQAIWIIHEASFIFISVLLYLKTMSLGLWISVFVLAIIALIILVYFWMVVYSYWSSLKVTAGDKQDDDSQSKIGNKPPPSKTSKALPQRQISIDETKPQA